MIFKNEANQRLFKRKVKYNIPYPDIVKKLEGKRNINGYFYTKDMVFNDFQKPAEVDQNIKKAIESLIAKAQRKANR
jgi:hypothetical protein